MQNDGGRTTLSGQRLPLGIADPFSAMLQAIPVGKAKRGDRRFNNIGGRV